MGKTPVRVLKPSVFHLCGNDTTVWLCGPKEDQTGPKADLYCGPCIREAFRLARVDLVRVHSNG